MQELTQQQVKALEDEARTRIQADEARSTRFGQAVERVSGEVESLARRLEAEERTTLQRVAKMEVCCWQRASWNVHLHPFIHFFAYSSCMSRIVASLQLYGTVFFKR